MFICKADSAGIRAMKRYGAENIFVEEAEHLTRLEEQKGMRLTDFEIEICLVSFREGVKMCKQRVLRHIDDLPESLTAILTDNRAKDKAERIC